MSEIESLAAQAGIGNCWILTDGKAGDELKCLGVAHALGLEPEIRRLSPRRPWVWAMPFGPIDPRDKSKNQSGPLSGKWPDLVIAAGRRAVPYVRQIRRETEGSVFTVILMDPRTGIDAADMIWVPEHDWLRGDNVLVTLTSPHMMSEARLSEARLQTGTMIDQYRRPYIGVLLGGDSHAFDFDEHSERELAYLLEQVAMSEPEGTTLLITPSRRTRGSTLSCIREHLKRYRFFLWDGRGENPYLQILAKSDQFIVTADSVNMVGEAVATGRPVHVFRPSGGHHKIDYFLKQLQEKGAIKPLEVPLEPYSYTPLDATPVIARDLAARYRVWREARDGKKP